MAAVLLILLQSPACASDLSRSGEGSYRHRLQGFEVSDPAQSGADGVSPWRRISVSGALLAYQGPGAATMSLIVRCDHPVGPPRAMARHLLIGLKDRQILEEGPVAVDGGEAWFQRVAVPDPGVELKTVTHSQRACSVDWVLTAAGGLEAVEGDFDRWWSSFRRTEEGDES